MRAAITRDTVLYSFMTDLGGSGNASWITKSCIRGLHVYKET